MTSVSSRSERRLTLYCSSAAAGLAAVSELLPALLSPLRSAAGAAAARLLSPPLPADLPAAANAGPHQKPPPMTRKAGTCGVAFRVAHDDHCSTDRTHAELAAA